MSKEEKLKENIMAIFRPTRKNSGVETLLKILSVLTSDITLVRGDILLSQFKVLQKECATKMSLFLDVDHSSYVGVRNTWLQDSGDNVIVTYADEQQAALFMMEFGLTKNWEACVPPENKEKYRLDQLDKAAEDIRNFMLLGVLPSQPMPPEYESLANDLLKTIEFDVIASLDPATISHLFKWQHKAHYSNQGVVGFMTLLLT